MGSTLTVDNIVGATTAANVKFPSGTPVQVVTGGHATYVRTTATSQTDTGLTASITPKFSDSIKHAKNASVSPLLRLNKLLKFLNIKFKDYNFLDLGSGQGISLHFVLDNYHFKNYYGLEFDEYLIDISKKNLFPLKKKFKIIHNDARKFFLEDSRYVIYLYNPFDKIILKQFLENNLNLLKKNECIIIYQNNFHAKYIERISKKEILIENGLSIYYF